MDTRFHGALSQFGGLLRPQLRCAFYRQSADEVDRLVAGASAHICDGCVAKCVAVLEEHGGVSPVAR